MLAEPVFKNIPACHKSRRHVPEIPAHRSLKPTMYTFPWSFVIELSEIKNSLLVVRRATCIQTVAPLSTTEQSLAAEKTKRVGPEPDMENVFSEEGEENVLLFQISTVSILMLYLLQRQH